MEENFIPHIYNYCDRWCERCPFTERCYSFSSEQAFMGALDETELTDLASDIAAGSAASDDDTPLDDVKRNLEGALDMLHEMLRKAGLSDDDMEQQPEPDTSNDTGQQEQDAQRMTLGYSTALKRFFSDNEAYFTAREQEFEQRVSMGLPLDLEQLQLMQNALSTLRWYEHFIGAKMYRAMGGFKQMEADDDPLQSDANGSAKIAMIAIQRSIDAWQYMADMFPELRLHIAKVGTHLELMRKTVLQFFPKWQQFHRPGFDDYPDNVVRFHYSPN
jgi:hypothetical protein